MYPDKTAGGHRRYLYEYDMENRLTKVSRSDTTVVATFEYDALGRRIEKVDAIAGTTTRYYYDDQRENGDWYVLPSGRLYLYPLSLAAALAERCEYDAYGQVQILTSAFSPLASSQHANPYTFTGRERDTLDAASLTLTYYRARTYDPQTGRFMQRDPLEYIDGTNLYEYVKSNPVNYIDPYGEMAEIAVGCGVTLSAAQIAALAAAVCGVIPDCRAMMIDAIKAAYSAASSFVNECCKVRCNFKNGGPHHKFIRPRFGIPPWKECWMNHIRITCWRQGVKKPPFLELQLGYGPCYKFRGGQGGITH